MSIPVIAIMGPTASGKTSLAIEVAQALNGEIISVDSALIYRSMDIGTAKPSLAEQQGIVHHLMDIVDPAATYSVADFRQDALSTIAAIQARDRVPILAGGTMLYFKALFSGLADLPATNATVREQVSSRIAEHGIAALHEYLASFDPETALRLAPGDTQRISRAVEVYLMSGKPLSQFHAEQQQYQFPWPLVEVAIAPNQRAVLHERIEQRFDAMLAAGFEQEVRALFERGDLTLEHPSMRCVGYRQMWQFFTGELSLDEARYRSIVATRQLAKRQFTWLRSWPTLFWLDSLAPNNSQKLLKYLGNISI